MSIVNALAIIGGLTVASALVGGVRYVWLRYKGATEIMK
jgi:hypothetical protein